MNEPNWQGKPQHPFREAIKLLAGGVEPPDYVQGYREKPEDIEVGKSMDLQGWMRGHCPLEWSTGIGLIEAAEKIVEEAVSNGNIPPEDSEWRREGRKDYVPIFSSTSALQKALGCLWLELHELEGLVASLSNGKKYDEDHKVKKAAIEQRSIEEASTYALRIREIVDDLMNKPEVPAGETCPSCAAPPGARHTPAHRCSRCLDSRKKPKT